MPAENKKDSSVTHKFADERFKLLKRIALVVDEEDAFDVLKTQNMLRKHFSDFAKVSNVDSSETDEVAWKVTCDLMLIDKGSRIEKLEGMLQDYENKLRNRQPISNLPRKFYNNLSRFFEDKDMCALVDMIKDTFSSNNANEQSKSLEKAILYTSQSLGIDVSTLKSLYDMRSVEDKMRLKYGFGKTLEYTETLCRDFSDSINTLSNTAKFNASYPYHLVIKSFSEGVENLREIEEPLTKLLQLYSNKANRIVSENSYNTTPEDSDVLRSYIRIGHSIQYLSQNAQNQGIKDFANNSYLKFWAAENTNKIIDKLHEYDSRSVSKMSSHLKKELVNIMRITKGIILNDKDVEAICLYKMFLADPEGLSPKSMEKLSDYFLGDSGDNKKFRTIDLALSDYLKKQSNKYDAISDIKGFASAYADITHKLKAAKMSDSIFEGLEKVANGTAGENDKLTYKKFSMLRAVGSQSFGENLNSLTFLDPKTRAKYIAAHRKANDFMSSIKRDVLEQDILKLMPGDLVMYSADKEQKIRGRNIAKYSDSGIQKMVTDYSHAAIVGCIDEENKPMLSHIQGAYEAIKVDSNLDIMAISDIYKFDIAELVSPQNKKILENSIGPEWRSIITKCYQDSMSEMQKTSWFKNIDNDKEKRISAGKYHVLQKVINPFGLGTHKNDYDQLRRVFFSNDVLESDKNNDTVSKDNKMICSEFVAKSIAACIEETNQKLRESYGHHGLNINAMEHPFGTRHLDKIPPEEVVKILKDKGCVKTMQSNGIARWFQKKELDENRADIFKDLHKRENNIQPWYAGLWERIVNFCRSALGLNEARDASRHRRQGAAAYINAQMREQIIHHAR